MVGICGPRTMDRRFEAQRKGLPDPGPMGHLYTSAKIQAGVRTTMCSWCGRAK